MKNWMQKYEDDKERTEEDILKERLNRLLDLVDNVKTYKVEDMIKCLSDVVKLYENLEKNGYELDKKDMILRKKQLTELKWKKLKNEYMETKESESWSDYREEESEEEER